MIHRNIKFSLAQNFVSVIMHFENPLDMGGTEQPTLWRVSTGAFALRPLIQPNFIVHRLKASKLTPKP